MKKVMDVPELLFQEEMWEETTGMTLIPLMGIIYIPCQSVFVQAAPMRKQTGRITISIACIGDAVLPGT